MFKHANFMDVYKLMFKLTNYTIKKIKIYMIKSFNRNIAMQTAYPKPIYFPNVFHQLLNSALAFSLKTAIH